METNQLKFIKLRCDVTDHLESDEGEHFHSCRPREPTRILLKQQHHYQYITCETNAEDLTSHGYRSQAIYEKYMR